jgi:uncharacterized protein (DUF2126 family)
MAKDYPFEQPNVTLREICKSCPALVQCLIHELVVVPAAKELGIDLDKLTKEDAEEEQAPEQDTPGDEPVEQSEQIDADAPEMSIWRNVLDTL